jgi:hypothetical protein
MTRASFFFLFGLPSLRNTESDIKQKKSTEVEEKLTSKFYRLFFLDFLCSAKIFAWCIGALLAENKSQGKKSAVARGPR